MSANDDSNSNFNLSYWFDVLGRRSSETAVSGAGAAIANVGPGLGQVIGPGGTYAPLPDAAKWVLSAGMLLGRLELFTILVLFTPTFWRG